ncbi:MAG: hypothetical protein E6Q32_03315 [Neisseriales bacterium]|jgi:hypothetical protein|nr:MAG: hypothetical protein E6Q32_03315 [Neisseriales bacterium]
MVQVRKKEKDAEDFINSMADKPYGVDDSIHRLTISMKTSLYERLDDIVRKRKRSKQENRTMSALIVEALENYVKQIK